MTLREQIEDTLDWMASVVGWGRGPRAPRAVRAAMRALGSDQRPVRERAEARLLCERQHSAPLLRQAARRQAEPQRAIRAAVLLHRLEESDARGLLHLMAHEPHLRSGEARHLLRQAVREVIGAETYARQAAAALMRLEQMPESVAAIVRFRQAMEIMRFLGAPLPADLLRRALLVRTVGGENLSLVRAVLDNTVDISIEHVCMARKAAIEMILHLDDRQKAFALLARVAAHPSPAVELTAMYGLERLGDPRAVVALQRIARDPESPVADDARRLIRRLRGGAPEALLLLRPSTFPAEPRELLRSSAYPDALDPATLLRPLSGE